MQRYIVDFGDSLPILDKKPGEPFLCVGEGGQDILLVTKTRRVVFPVFKEGWLSPNMITALSEAWDEGQVGGKPPLIMVCCQGKVGLGMMPFDGEGATEVEKFPFE